MHVPPVLAIIYIYIWVKLLNLHRWVLKYHEIWFVELHLFFVSISISICWSSRFPLWFTVVLFLMLDLQPWKKQGSNLNINNISRHMHACVLRIFYIIQYIDMHTHIHIFLYIYIYTLVYHIIYIYIYIPCFSYWKMPNAPFVSLHPPFASGAKVPRT